MRFRFTLQYEEEQVEINEPDGFADCVLKLARDKDFHSLIEFFDGSFIFYGDNGVINGGIHNIKEWEQRGGPDATILVFVDFTLDETNYFQLFSGQLDLSLGEEMPDNKMRIPIIRDDSWAKFYNRKDTPVDLQALVDLDGADIIPVSTIDLNLISQIIKKTSLWRGFASIGDWEFDSSGSLVDTSSPPSTVEEEIVLWSQVTTIKEIDEITESYELGLAFEDTEPIINIVNFIDEGGDMSMNWKFRIALNFDLRYLPVTSDATKIQSVEVQTDLYYRLNEDPITFLEGENHTNTFTPYSQSSGVQKNLTATIYQDFNLIPGLDLDVEPGDELFFYAKHTITFTYQVSGDDPDSAIWMSRSLNGFISNYGGLDEEPYTRIEFDSVFRNTISPGFFVHDSAAAILKSHGIGENPFYSEFLGSAETLARQYNSDGCGWRHANAKGLHVRGWSIQEKPYSMSFMQWWKGLYPILNLGLTYDEIVGASEEAWTPDEVPPLNFWGAFGPPDPDMVWTGGIANPFLTVSPGLLAGHTSQAFGPVGMTLEAGHTYKYSYRMIFHVDLPTLLEDVNVHFRLLDIGGVVLAEDIFTTTATNTTSPGPPHSYEFVAPVGVNRFDLTIEYPDGTTSDGLITIFEFTDLTVPVEEGEGEIIPVIRVEQVEEFYDPDFIVELSNVRQITRKYDTEKIYNKIEIGYTEWKAEATSGINDPQTKRVYSTRFKKIGQAIQIFSDWIAASIAWEETRRQSVDRTKDYKFDDYTFILRLSDQGSSGGYDPEFDENFSSVTNLNNSNRRYNIGLSVARNFLRFRRWLNGCLDKYVGSVYKFVSGEGNYDMTSTMNPQSPDCMEEDFDGEPLSEKQDIPVTNENIHLTYHYTIEHPMSLIDYLRTVRFRKKAIGVSLTDSDHVALFIDELSYKPVKGTAQISGWSKEYIDIHPVDGVAPTQQCFPSTECENALTDEFGEIITDEEGVCITA